MTAKHVEVLVASTDLEEGVVRSIPLVNHLFNEIFVIPQLEADRSLVFFASGVADHPQPHLFIIVLPCDGKMQPVHPQIFRDGLGSRLHLFIRCDRIESPLGPLSTKALKWRRTRSRVSEPSYFTGTGDPARRRFQADYGDLRMIPGAHHRTPCARAG